MQELYGNKTQNTKQKPAFTIEIPVSKTTQQLRISRLKKRNNNNNKI